MPKKPGVYLQCTSDEALERELVQIVLRRDLFLEKAVDVTAKVKDRLRPLDEESTLETLAMLTAARTETVNLILQIEQWQKKYTVVKRPTINGGDYMVRLLKHVEFANTLAIKRTFNFQIGRGNLFMLPLINAKSMPPVKITDNIRAEIEAFASPDVAKLAAATAVLKKSLPKKLLAEIMPLEHWISNRWVPSISICSYFLKPEEESKLPKIKKKADKAISAPASPGHVTPLLSPLGQGEKGSVVVSTRGPESLPPLQRMNSDISVISQLSDVSVKSVAVSIKPAPSGEGISRLNSFDSAAVSRKTEAPVAPAPAPPKRNFNTLAMRNWFVAENSDQVIDIPMDTGDANSEAVSNNSNKKGGGGSKLSSTKKKPSS